MVNMKTITQAIERVLREGLADEFIITRNEELNEDPNQAAFGKGWIGIYKNDIIYERLTTGNRPWLAHPKVDVVVQVANSNSGEAAEDALEDATSLVLNVLNASRNFHATVGQITGFTVEYGLDRNEDTFLGEAKITIETEVRA